MENNGENQLSDKQVNDSNDNLFDANKFVSQLEDVQNTAIDNDLSEKDNIQPETIENIQQEIIEPALNEDVQNKNLNNIQSEHENIQEETIEAILIEDNKNITSENDKFEIDDILPETIENVDYDINQDEIELVNVDDSIDNNDLVDEIQDNNNKIIDYTSQSKIELIESLKTLITNPDVQGIKNEVEEIKFQFYKLHKAEITAQKREYFDKNGDLDNFETKEDKEEEEFKLTYQKFKELKTESNDVIEREKENNLKIKQSIVEDIKNLVHKQEPINKVFNEFRELQQKWRDTGLVPQSSMKDLWHNYNMQIEKFYEFVKIDKDLRDLDYKKNLEAKLVICEKAEELLLEPILKKAVAELQNLHLNWTETGPVSREKNEEIWERFKQTSIKINKRYQDYLDKIKIELEANLAAKIHITEKAEEISNIEISGKKEWDIKTKEIIDLQKMWKTYGAVPKKDSNIVFEKFRGACDKFFNNKKEYFYSIHENDLNNLQAKMDLCVQAESLKDSTDWKKTSTDLINLQNKWKQIGPVPMSKSEEIWQRFRGACNTFFNNKANYYSSFDTMLEENVKIKLNIIEKIEKFEHSDNIDENLQQLKQFQKEWTETGQVPLKNRLELQNNFRTAINNQFDKLNLNETKRDILKYKLKIENISQQPNSIDKIFQEKEFIREKIKALEADITLLDNNIGFFAKSKNAESLLSELNKKIENGKAELKLLKDKLKMLDKLNQ